MSEAILRQDWLPQVEVAFEKLKAACTAERKEWCEVIREDHGPEAEAELKAKLAAHDQAMQARLKVIDDSGQEAVKPVGGVASYRRDRKPRVAAAPLKDVLDVASEVIPEPEIEIAGDKPPELSTILDNLKMKKPEGFFKNSGVQLEVEEARPTPEAEPAETTGKALVPVARFGNETPRTADTGAATLAQSAPYDTAKEYARRHCFCEGVLAMYFWLGEFWEWNGRYYATVEEQIIRDRVYAFLDGSWKFAGGDGLTRFRPTPKLVNEVLDALRSGIALPKTCLPPMWLDSDEPANDVLVFRNGLVNVLTGQQLMPTPKLWVHGAVDYDYDPEAKCPQWEKFLEQVFPDDKESQDCIEEQLGYGMTEETKFEKAGLWIGARRSGKGTTAFVQRKLTGEEAYVGLSLSTWVVNENSKECLVGKRVGVFPDVRLKPGRHFGASYDAGGISHTSQELLLNITGRDTLTVGRKYKAVWQGQLRLKIIMISNKVPNFNDPVLVSRFIKVHFAQSFEKREDVDLRDKLKAEISGIAARCIAAYRRLIARGKFIQPESGLDLERKVLAESDPWTAFIYDLFVIDPAATVSCSILKMKFEIWCGQHGRVDMLRTAATASLLTQRLKENVVGLEELRTFRPHDQPRLYVGLRLKTKNERGHADPLEPPEPLKPPRLKNTPLSL